MRNTSPRERSGARIVILREHPLHGRFAAVFAAAFRHEDEAWAARFSVRPFPGRPNIRPERGATGRLDVRPATPVARWVSRFWYV